MDYIEVFKNLKTNNKYGHKSPHKAILLLSIIEMYEKQELVSNEIKYNKTLTSTFLKIWNKSFPNETIFISNAYFPFWQLQNDDFWHIMPNKGKENILTLLADTDVSPSELKILECVKYAELDEDLYFELTLPSSRSALKRVLLEEYTQLSSTTIDRLTKIEDTYEDKSINALEQYTKILSNNTQNNGFEITGIQTSNEYYSCLNEDVKIAINIEYYTFLKKHKQERDLIKEAIPNVVELCNIVAKSTIKQGDYTPSVLLLYEDFLYDLKIALMSEDNSSDFIRNIDKSIDTLKGIETEPIIDSNLKYDNDIYSNVDDLETIKEAIESNNNELEQEFKPIYSIKNEGNICSIINQIGEVVYTTTGKFKLFNGIIYRFNLKPICFTVKRMMQEGDKWIKGEKLIALFKESPLFKILNPDYYLDQIYDFKENPIQINIEGKLYDYAGDFIRDSDNNNEILNNENTNHYVEYNDYRPEHKLYLLKDIADRSFDFLWVLAIVDFVSDSQHQCKLTYDEIAIKMISFAWEILNNHSELKEKETLITECIEYLITEFKETNTELTWNSPRYEIYDAIKDYPMSDVYEDCVNTIIETTPLDVLKIWLVSENKQDLVSDSMDYLNGCLYAIYQKKLDPYIVINPDIIRYIYRDNEKLKEYFKSQYIDFFKNKFKDNIYCESDSKNNEISEYFKTPITKNNDRYFKSSTEEVPDSKPLDIIVDITVKNDTFIQLENGNIKNFKKGIIDKTTAELLLENPDSPFVFYTRVSVCPLKAKHIDFINFSSNEKTIRKKVINITFTPGVLGSLKEVWIANIEIDK